MDELGRDMIAEMMPLRKWQTVEADDRRGGAVDQAFV